LNADKGKNKGLNRLLPKSLFAWSKTFSDKSKACSSPAPAGFAKTYSQKNVLMTAQRNFCLGNSPSTFDKNLNRQVFFDNFSTLGVVYGIRQG